MSDLTHAKYPMSWHGIRLKGFYRGTAETDASLARTWDRPNVLCHLVYLCNFHNIVPKLAML